MSKGLILPSIPFLNLFLYLSFPKDRSRVIYARNSSPGDPVYAYQITPLAISHMYYILEQLSGSAGHAPSPPLPPSPLPVPLEVYIESKGMGLVWPAYLNASTIELRSSIPVHITQGSDKPPQGSEGDRELWWGEGVREGGREMEMRGWVYFGRGFKVNTLALLYHRGWYLRRHLSLPRINAPL